MPGIQKGKKHRRIATSAILKKVRKDQKESNKQKLNNEIIPKRNIKLPEPPPSLSPMALQEWEHMCRLLADLGIINQLDKMALAFYCDNYALWVESGIELAKEGQSVILKGQRNGGAYRNLWFDIRRQAEARIFQYMALFGLSPSDRARLKITTPEDDLEDNPFAHI